MKRIVLIAVLLLLVCVNGMASNNLSAFSKVLLSKRHTSDIRGVSKQTNEYQAFISITDNNTIDSLRSVGVTVNAVFDGFVTAQIPVHSLKQVASMAGVKHVSLGQHIYLCNDSARYYSNVNSVHNAIGRIAPLTGHGVIVGMIDTGFDFNHVNLCDENGKSRVKAVYLPCDSTGVSPMIDGYELPGSCFETPEAIVALTTDNPASSHATHTTGTAAGSCFSNGLHGVATGADIVACGMSSQELNDVNIANSVRYIVDYADRMGKPCVINMSLASNDGPNDGTSYLCKTFESISGPGHICVLSAGNDGFAPICFHQTLMGSCDTVTTLLRNRYGGSLRQGYVSMWNDGAQEHRSRVVIINRQTGEIEYASPMIGLLPNDSIFVIDSRSDEVFSSYYTGEMYYVNAVEQLEVTDELNASRFHSYWVFDATSVRTGHLLGLQYVVDEPTQLTGWCTSNTYFYSFDLPGITGGSSSGSISDLATTDSVISVGAYSTRRYFVNKDGEQKLVSGSYPTDIAYFSSFGPDENGITRPDIAAPGFAVLSSANRYDIEATQQNWITPVIFNGISYPYYSNQGTSMSAPVVSGTIALMLQVNPNLSPSMVREALRMTAIKDSFVMNGDHERWGFGKLDAGAAVDYVISNTLLQGDVNNDGEVTIADVLALIDIVLDSSARDDAAVLIRADINRDNEIQIADINCLIDIILK